MSDELGLKAKTDVLDFVISFIVEHEKRMDQMVERLERVAERLAQGRGRITVRQDESEEDIPRQGVFTLTISNPEDYEKLKSIRIDWESGEREYTPEISEIDAILDKIDFSFRDDR